MATYIVLGQLTARGTKTRRQKKTGPKARGKKAQRRGAAPKELLTLDHHAIPRSGGARRYDTHGTPPQRRQAYDIPTQTPRASSPSRIQGTLSAPTCGGGTTIPPSPRPIPPPTPSPSCERSTAGVSPRRCGQRERSRPFSTWASSRAAVSLILTRCSVMSRWARKSVVFRSAVPNHVPSSSATFMRLLSMAETRGSPAVVPGSEATSCGSF